MPATFQLYSYRRCPFAMRVRMTLHEKNIPFQIIEEDLDRLSDDLLSLHPEGRVPLLVHGDNVIYESSIITEYLDDLVAEPRLMPQDAAARMRVRLWTYWCNNIFKLQVDYYKYGSEDEVEAAETELRKLLAKIEVQLMRTKWLEGDEFTLADIHVFPFVRQLSRVTPLHPAFDDSPRLVAWINAMSSRPSFVKAMEKPTRDQTGESQPFPPGLQS